MSKMSTQIARGLRQRMTAQELLLWRALRNKRLAGFKFRRQHPIGAYVVDFYSSASQLAVEVDGTVHHHLTDRQRDAWLNSIGLQVLRFTNPDVELRMPMVLDVIEAKALSSRRGLGEARWLETPSPIFGEGRGEAD